MSEDDCNAIETIAGDRMYQLLDIDGVAVRVTCHDHVHIWGQTAALLQEREGGDHERLRLTPRDLARQQQHALFRPDLPCSPQLRDTLRRYRIRIEVGELYAPRGYHELLRQLWIDLPDMRGRKFRVGDHYVAACHHRVVEPLQRALSAIDPMIGGNERDV